MTREDETDAWAQLRAWLRDQIRVDTVDRRAVAEVEMLALPPGDLVTAYVGDDL